MDTLFFNVTANGINCLSVQSFFTPLPPSDVRLLMGEGRGGIVSADPRADGFGTRILFGGSEAEGTMELTIFSCQMLAVEKYRISSNNKVCLVVNSLE